MIVIAATQNRHKIREIEEITSSYGFTVKSLSQTGYKPIKVAEDGLTFEENSFKKAMEIHKATGRITIADDSGLMVDCLNGAPGVHSSRFAGEEGNDYKNNEKLLRLLKDVPLILRGASFVSVITMVFTDTCVVTAKGECRGRILHEERGKGGFGYDPLFVPSGWNKSFAELSYEEKNRISHRAQALQHLSCKLVQMFGSGMGKAME